MKYWVFDLDGTLVDSFEPYFSLMEELFNFKLTDDQKKNYIAMHPALVFANHLEQDKIPAALSELQTRSERQAIDVRPFDQTHAVFSALRQNGKRIAVWTSRDYRSTELILKHTGLDQMIDHMVSGECVKQRKPNPEGLVNIQKRFECRPEDMVMVGDHEHDMLAAHQLGVFSVRASWHKHWDDGICTVANKQFSSNDKFYEWLVSTTLLI